MNIKCVFMLLSDIGVKIVNLYDCGIVWSKLLFTDYVISLGLDP